MLARFYPCHTVNSRVRALLVHTCTEMEFTGTFQKYSQCANCTKFDVLDFQTFTSSYSTSPGPRQYKNGFSTHALNRLFSACNFAFRIVWKSCIENIRAVHELSNFCKDPEFAVIVKIGGPGEVQYATLRVPR